MQYHLNGFRPGDPHVAPPAPDVRTVERRGGGDDAAMPDEVDVLIVGCGPAGLTLAAQLSAYPSVTTRIIDLKTGPLRIGQADGVACRSMEMFEALGFAEQVVKEAYWVNETSFWRPAEGDGQGAARGIVRADRIQDVEDDLSEFPHTILSQARIHDFLLRTMEQSGRRLQPDYGRRFDSLTIERTDAGHPVTHPVTVTMERVDAGHEGEVETVNARYLVGCDGARSRVRRSLGLGLGGDSANKLWGVMDVLAVTDFPDIRLKSAVQSASDGSVLIIPREGGYMVRIYTELGELAEGERAADRNLTPEQIIEAASRILRPYTIEVKEVAWWSAYEIGQRLCDRFDDSSADAEPRVFIAGDACHTHSPKAGQGMNVAMADSFNLGWKLGSVVTGSASSSILSTYSAERQAVAQELIDFDREMAELFSLRADDEHQAPEDTSAGESSGQADFQAYFAKHGRYTAGVETRYGPSLITGTSVYQDLASGLTVGKRFHSAPVVRLADAKPLQLSHTVKADGRWRLFLFAPDGFATAPWSPVGRLCRFLSGSLESPLRRYTPTGADVDSVIDVRAVFQTGHRRLAIEDMPPLLLPRKGALGLIDYEKIFCPDLTSGSDIFDMRGIDRGRGCVVVVRPDQHVASVLPLHAHGELAAFFDGFMVNE